VPKKIPGPSESAIQTQILTYLGHKQVFVWRNNSGALINPKGRPVRFGRPGSADILGLQRGTGRFIAIEVKKPDTLKSLTDLQRGFLEDIHDYGGLAGVATCLEDVDRILGGEYLIPAT